eukprot:1138052-Pelagomonas_calceolata.AAC.2
MPNLCQTHKSGGATSLGLCKIYRLLCLCQTHTLVVHAQNHRSGGAKSLGLCKSLQTPWFVPNSHSCGPCPKPQISWCKVEVGVDSPKSVLCDPNHQSLKSRSSPMLTTASLNLKTVVNPKTQQHEVRVYVCAHACVCAYAKLRTHAHACIVAASVVYLSNCVDIEAPMPSEKWNKHQVNTCMSGKTCNSGKAAGDSIVVYLSGCLDIEAPLPCEKWIKQQVTHDKRCLGSASSCPALSSE